MWMKKDSEATRSLSRVEKFEDPSKSLENGRNYPEMCEQEAVLELSDDMSIISHASHF